MALVLADRVQETTTTAGTGTLSLAGASTGYRTFVSGVGSGNTTYYVIYDSTAQEWEVGLGTVTSGAPSTLSRTTVYANSSGTTSPLTLAGNSSTVWCDYPASRAVYKDANGNVVLANWTEALTTASPNATVPVTSFTSLNASYTNIDAALIPKGTGAILAAIPDGTATGGNKRGTNSVDLQTYRTANTAVASGNYAVAVGNNNTASANFSYAIGYGNTSSGGDSVVVGSASSATNTYASAYGYSNSATGSYSCVIGGQSGNARSITGKTVFPASASPIAAATGTSQCALLVAGVQTTDATTTTLTSAGGSPSTTNQVVLPNNAAYYFKGSVIATVTGGGNTKAWTFEGAIKRGASAATTAIVGTVTTNVVAADSGASAWTIAVTADTSLGCLKIAVTGQASTTIRWLTQIQTTEVNF